MTDRRSAPPRRAALLRKDLRKVYADGVAFSVMVGIGETYLPAFVLALGMGEKWSGLIATLPLVAGGLIQLASPAAVRRLGSRRRWVAMCAAAQALSFLPLIAIAATATPGALVFAIAALYWAAGMGASAGWNAWVESLVPRRIRARYFGRRSGGAQVGVLAGLLAGGVLLDAATSAGHQLTGFAVLFGAAALARFLSARLLASTSEPSPPSVEGDVPPREVLRRFRHGKDGRLLLYLIGTTTAVMIAGPFFTPYMLGELHLTYSAYMSLIGAAFVSKILALPILGRLATRHGSHWLLRAGGAGIVPISGLWLVSENYTYLLALQFVSGVVWAAHELGSFLMFFEEIRGDERTSLLASFNLVNAAAIVAGSLVGGAILHWTGESLRGYHWVFALSVAARVLTLPLLGRLGVRAPVTQPGILRTIALRPSVGAVMRPIWATFDEFQRIRRGRPARTRSTTNRRT
jgi:MFS family permease